MSVILRSGGYRVLASGETFLFAPNSELCIDINENAVNLKLTMRFLHDNTREPRIDYESYSGRLFMFCYNFGPEAGPKEPRLLQETNGRKVFIMFRYFEAGHDRQIRSVKYTVFTETRREDQ